MVGPLCSEIEVSRLVDEDVEGPVGSCGRHAYGRLKVCIRHKIKESTIFTKRKTPDRACLWITL